MGGVCCRCSTGSSNLAAPARPSRSGGLRWQVPPWPSSDALWAQASAAVCQHAAPWTNRRSIMSTEQTQQAMQGYLDMLVKRGAYGQYFTDDCVFVLMGPRQETKGKQAVEQFIRYFHEQAFDAEPQVKTLLCGDGQAALEAVFHGTHTAEFLGVSATGRMVDVPYTVFYEL